MKHTCVNTTLLFVALLLGTTTFAQKSTKPGTVWKKVVIRQVSIAEPTDEKEHHLRTPGIDTTFAEKLFNAIKAGKVTAYSNFDHSFTEKRTVKQLEEILIPRPDTQLVVDPITGQEKMIVVHHDLDFDKFIKYRVLEEWTFDRSTGNTNIHITGIAPLVDIYGDAGDYRGSKAVFWVKYSEVVSLLEQYELYHLGKSLPNYIWNDYFYTDVKPQGEK